jgi:hypothetical protein
LWEVSSREKEKERERERKGRGGGWGVRERERLGFGKRVPMARRRPVPQMGTVGSKPVCRRRGCVQAVSVVRHFP